MLTTLHSQRNPVLCIFLLFTKDLSLWFIIIFISIIIIIIITAWNSFVDFFGWHFCIYLLKMLPDTEIGHKPWLIQTFFVLPLSARRVCVGVGVGRGRCRRVCVGVCACAAITILHSAWFVSFRSILRSAFSVLGLPALWLFVCLFVFHQIPLPLRFISIFVALKIGPEAFALSLSACCYCCFVVACSVSLSFLFLFPPLCCLSIFFEATFCAPLFALNISFWQKVLSQFSHVLLRQ